MKPSDLPGSVLHPPLAHFHFVAPEQILTSVRKCVADTEEQQKRDLSRQALRVL